MMTRGRRRRDGWEGGARQRSGCGSRSLFNGRLKKTQSPKPRQAWDGVFSGDPRLLGVIWELAGALGVAGERRLTVECRGWFSGRSRGCENLKPPTGGGVEGVHHQVPCHGPSTAFYPQGTRHGQGLAALQDAVKQSQRTPVLLSQPAAHPRGPLSPLNGRRPGGQRAVAQRRWGRHLGGNLARALSGHALSFQRTRPPAAS